MIFFHWNKDEKTNIRWKTLKKNNNNEKKINVALALKWNT